MQSRIYILTVFFIIFYLVNNSFGQNASHDHSHDVSLESNSSDLATEDVSGLNDEAEALEIAQDEDALDFNLLISEGDEDEDEDDNEIDLGYEDEYIFESSGDDGVEQNSDEDDSLDASNRSLGRKKRRYAAYGYAPYYYRRVYRPIYHYPTTVYHGKKRQLGVGYGGGRYYGYGGGRYYGYGGGRYYGYGGGRYYGYRRPYYRRPYYRRYYPRIGHGHGHGYHHYH